MTSAVRLRLFKLRMFDDHCHIVVSHDDRGEAVDVPGVDLRGDEAAMAFEAAAPLLEMLASRGGGRELRALSLHLERQRLIATFHSTETETTPTVVRIDAGSDYELVMSAAAAVMSRQWHKIHKPRVTGIRRILVRDPDAIRSQSHR